MYVHGVDLTGALHVLQFQRSPPPPSSLAPLNPQWRHTDTGLSRLCWKKILHRHCIGPLHGSSSPFSALSRQWLNPIKPVYRRLISKSAFMQFLAIFTFLHIWEDVGRGYLKMQGP